MSEPSKPDTAQPQRPKDRVVFIDQARTIALIMMMAGHSLDQFLGEPWRSSQGYQEYQFFRGITSALFLMVSGFSFVVASFKYWDDYVRFSPRLFARLRRIGYILFFAYLLHLYGETLIAMFDWYTPKKLAGSLRFDVLQNIGFSLFLVHAMAFAVRKREHFWKAAAVLFVFVIGIAGITWDPAVDAALPHWLSPALNALPHNGRRSDFPLIPFTGFMLVGAFFAYWFWLLKQKGAEKKAIIAMVLTGAAFIGFEQVLWQVVARDEFLLPGNTFARCGSAMLVIGGLYFLEKKVVLLPRLSLTMSKDSLGIYVAQGVIIYGGTLGLLHEYKKGLPLPAVFAYIIVLVAVMALLAFIISTTRNRFPDGVTRVRRTLILAWFILFFAWPRSTWTAMAVSLALAALFMYRRELLQLFLNLRKKIVQ